ncbi:bifunctional UDP-sugar hydrolase/5'-nucleotidase [Hydrogenoanaerobacterium sp.]|uniref:bifunctional metallophosphatase/5'-nucleotidase n=1 Tax=Hydrogenoanaerobacterium sp. TaxID=2953763 RepID=UPI00289ABB80|nr:bifunctional UDP-sugar hydrolase/5'-nucleotidase [Hydrogenoanaerobacterium sp.]
MTAQKRIWSGILALVVCISMVYGSTISAFAEGVEPDAQTTAGEQPPAAPDVYDSGNPVVDSGTPNDSENQPLEAAAPPSDYKTITILHTNDIHGNFAGDKLVSADYVAALKQSIPGSILVDAGDATQGSSFATLTKGKDVIRLMNSVGYDVMAAGNHEFDYGLDALLSNAKLAEFPILSANAIKDGKPILEGVAYGSKGKVNNGAYEIFEADGIKLGFFGITTPETAVKTNPAGIVGVSFGEDNVDTVAAICQQNIDELKAAGADVVIGMMHVGIDSSSEVTTRKLAEKLTGIDVIIDGHSHSMVTETQNGILIGQTGSGSKNIGRIEIAIGTDGKKTMTNKLLDLDAVKALGITPDAEVASLAKSIVDSQKELLSPVVGSTKTSLWGGTVNGLSEARLFETNLGSLIADSMADAAKNLIRDERYKDLPIVALQNGGGVRAVIKNGKITKGDVINVLPFGNSLAFKLVSPKVLYEVFETGLAITGQDFETGRIDGPVGGFPQISGVRVEFNPDLAKGSRVYAIYLSGKDRALDPNDEAESIILASNDFLIAGGDGYDVLKGLTHVGEGGVLDEIFEKYLTELTAKSGGAFYYPITAGRMKTVGAYQPKPYTASILVTDETQVPLKDVNIRYRIDNGSYRIGTTNANGMLVLSNLPVGPHGVLIEGADEVLVNNYSGAGMSKEVKAIGAIKQTATSTNTSSSEKQASKDWSNAIDRARAAASGDKLSLYLEKDDQISATILEAIAGKDVTLTVSYNGSDYVISGKNIKVDASRIYYTPEDLIKMVAPIDSDTAVNPDTGLYVDGGLVFSTIVLFATSALLRKKRKV